MATFTTTLHPSGGNNVGIVVPPEVLESFARGKRVPVVVTVEGYTYRTTTASMGGQVLVSFNAETRAATGRGAGDEVEVTMEVDDAPRTVEVPAALAAELDDTTRARWEALSPSARKAHALSIESAKTDETRARRIDKVLAALRT